MTLPFNQICVLDFETYWDKDFTLKKLSITEYVRDPRFEVISMAYRIWKNGHWRTKPKFSHGMAGSEHSLGKIDWSRTALLCHHTQFDGFILTERFGIKPAFYLDTLSMSRVCGFDHSVGGSLDAIAKALNLSGKVGKDVLLETQGKRPVDFTREEWQRMEVYNRGDVDQLWQIYRHLVEDFPEDELRLIDMTVRMQCEPHFVLNKARTRRTLAEEIRKKHELLAQAWEHLPEEFQQMTLDQTIQARLGKILGSSIQLRQLLTHFIPEEEIPMKWSVKQKKMVPAFAKTDLAFQALAEEGPEPVRVLLSARQNVKSTIGETRARRLLLHGQGGPVPVYLNYSKAHTLRWTGGDKSNMQNLKARGEGGAELRECLQASSGYTLLIVDSRQIEARFVCWLAGQDNMLDIFADAAQDPYKYQASLMYEKPQDRVSSQERFLGKTTTLGSGYGMGWQKYRMTLAQGILGPPLAIDKETAQRTIKAYRARNRHIVELWGQLQARIRMMCQGVRDIPPLAPRRDNPPMTLRFEPDCIWMPNGLTLEYPDIRVQIVEREFENDDGEIYTRKVPEYTYKSTDRTRARLYGGLLTENIIQCLARIAFGWQCLNIQEKYPILLVAHDEAVVLVPRKEAKKALKFCIEQFAVVPDWAQGCPLAGEGIISRVYTKA